MTITRRTFNRGALSLLAAAVASKHAIAQTQEEGPMLSIEPFTIQIPDAAIADLASILRFEMRRNDQVFRFGGEEFVVLLEVDSSADLEAATERLRKAVRGALRGPGGRITISLGSALLREQEKTWHDWFSRADAALYRAKSAGRDNYVIADDLF